MKTSLFVTTALTLALAATAVAQETPAADPDYTKPTLIRIFSVDDTPPPRERRIKHSFGAIEFRALGMDWRISYLPIAMPLAGSRMRTTNEWPDAFALTGTEFAAPPRT